MFGGNFKGEGDLPQKRKENKISRVCNEGHMFKISENSNQPKSSNRHFSEPTLATKCKVIARWYL